MGLVNCASKSDNCRAKDNLKAEHMHQVADCEARKVAEMHSGQALIRMKGLLQKPSSCAVLICEFGAAGFVKN